MRSAAARTLAVASSSRDGVMRSATTSNRSLESFSINPIDVEKIECEAKNREMNAIRILASARRLPARCPERSAQCGATKAKLGMAARKSRAVFS